MPTPGPLELVIILVIALLVLGPGRLPDVGAALGKSLREFRKAASDVEEATKVDTSPLPSTPPAAEATSPPDDVAPAPPAEAGVGASASTSSGAATGPAPSGPETDDLAGTGSVS